MKKHILVVEDDKDIAELIRLHLTDLGHQIVVEHNGDEAWRVFRQGSFDLVVLDIMLPGLDGLEICRRIRQHETRYTSVLMLTARTTELDRVLGLELGADDYLSKPFSLPECVARVKALLRRSEGLAKQAPNRPLCIESLQINPESRSVSRAGEALDLTAKEFDLLYHFARHPGQVFSRLQLLDQVWGYNHEGYEHTVNTHINRLRQKIEPDCKKPRYIKTIWGVGYQFPGDFS
ncbi:MAG: response regulator transcription factor [bacterium]